MSYKLTFKELGRTKFSGSVIVKNLNHKNLKKAVAPYLRSEPDFQIDEDENGKLEGIVFAGWYTWYFDIEKVHSDTLKLVLKNEWFDKIKSGIKTHEYRKMSDYWENRFNYKSKTVGVFYPGEVLSNFPFKFVQFQRAFYKNPERMLFKIKKVTLQLGRKTDLKYDGGVFDIELGERLK